VAVLSHKLDWEYFSVRVKALRISSCLGSKGISLLVIVDAIVGVTIAC